MSTGANIKVPFKSKDYYIESDGYPKDVVPYLRGIVESAREEAEEKQKNPEENWVDRLRLKFEKRTEGPYPELIMHRSQFCSYNYKVTEDGEVLYRGSMDEEWQEYNEE